MKPSGGGGFEPGARPLPERIVVDALQVAPEYSGVGREVAELGEQLRGLTLPVPLVVRCCADIAPMLAQRFPAGTEFQTPLASSRPRWRRIAYQQLVAPLRDDRSTLLLAIGEQAPVWGRARLLFLINDVRRISEPGSAGGRLERLYYSLTLRRGARRAWRILTISSFSEVEIRRVLRPQAEIRVISIFPRSVEAGGPAQAGGGGEPTFLTVGALRSYKGHSTLIEALALLGPDSPVRVLCIGDGEGRSRAAAELARLARERGVEAMLAMTGWLSDAELRRRYGECMATISPSLHEGYGLSVAESLAHGRPAIASDIAPHREIAGDAALYFDPGDAAGLADAMRSLLANPDLPGELAERAQRRARELAAAAPTWADELSAAVD